MTQQPQAKYRHDYRAPEYLISDIDLTFDLDAAKTVVTAESKVSRHAAASDVPLRLDGEDLTLIALQVNGQPWSDYKEENNQLVIGGLPEHFTLTIVNEISPAANTALEGLYQSGEALCTQCEAEGFRHITWYLDRPDVLARFTTKIIADKAKYPFLLSNGNRMAEGELENGRHWVQWQDPFPKPCYLFALVAGDFDVLRDSFRTRSGREVALELYVDRGNLDRAPWAMTSLKNSMKWDEERFGLEYDLDIYMIVAVDFFNMGAMENKGLNVFNSKYVLARTDTATDKDYLDIERVIGHEYFHNWTGNRVTCRDWFQLSLKEGLTVFRDQEFSSDLGSRAVNRINNVRTMRGLQFAEDASPMAHPIRPDMVIEMNNFYTLTVYEKGAEVIRMLHTLLGEENFQKGMQLYFERHDGSAATCDDFVQAMEDASNVDLSHFRLWYSQSGTPIVTVHDDYNPETEQYTLTISQRTPPTAEQAEKQPLHIPFAIELYDNEGKVIPLQKGGHPVHPVLNVTQAEQTFVFDNVYFQPVPALLCEFSAPVKLEYKWSDQQLTFLMRHARNDFSRWDAAQSLLATYIKLNAVREALTRTLANELADEFLAVYNANKLDSYRVEHADIGKRALRNTCLRYLAFAEPTLGDKLVATQYHQADNMTDALAALSAAVAAELPCRDALMQEYDDKWHQDGLVMDKWFILQSTSPAANVVETVRGLLNHRSFSMSNPNRVRSLIGAFASSNPAAFHAEDGSGYQFLVEMLTELNQRNPQVASRLIEPLIRLKRYDEKRQALMRAALEQLKGLENLSGDLFEKISKALA
ncbi:aminopeptidase N [Klebsiella pneumoniae]|uniref:aminopeptidase N n=1 Tax=Klebsiella pneumoniae TaxID=573 RepID=UPI000B3E28BF|nr:aminopeptidase N [Klebsiella pneumoniae]